MPFVFGFELFVWNMEVWAVILGFAFVIGLSILDRMDTGNRA